MSDKHLSARDVLLLTAVAERLIPSDENGPGAREANVAGYLRSALSGAYRDDVPAYAKGLRALDVRARVTHGDGYCELPTELRDALLADAEADDAPFFEMVRCHVLEGMFGDPAWGGNAGYVGWDLIGYPGVRAAWSDADQQLDVTLEPAHQSLLDLGGSIEEQP